MRSAGSSSLRPLSTRLATAVAVSTGFPIGWLKVLGPNRILGPDSEMPFLRPDYPGDDHMRSPADFEVIAALGDRARLDQHSAA